MNLKKVGLPAGLWLLAATAALPARTLYVAPGGTNDAAAFYPSWSGAATSIHAAVAVAMSNDQIWVTNATYKLTNQLVILSNLVVRSFNSGALDPAGTVLDADNFDGKPVTNRCLNLSNVNAVVAGFTFTGGRLTNANGGGVLLDRGTLSNCVIRGNSVTGGIAGGLYLYTNCLVIQTTVRDNTSSGGGGGIYCNKGGVLQDCLVSNNVSASGSGTYGGGVLMKDGGLLLRCALIGNAVSTTNAGSGDGGGVYIDAVGSLQDCTVRANTCSRRGGGCAILTGARLENCLIADNVMSSASGSGGGVYSYGGQLFNCLISSNYSGRFGGGLAMLTMATLAQNCTVSGNSAANSGGGVYPGSSTNSVFLNCILYGNSGGTASNYFDVNRVRWTNCCAAGSSDLDTWGQGNLTANPRFASPAAGDYRLTDGSPCLNAGLTLAEMSDLQDVAGRPRVDRIWKRVDIGAYEWLPSGSLVGLR